MTTTPSFWTERAEAARQAGYIAGEWEHLLRCSLQRARPELVEELAEDLDAYIVVQVDRVQRLYASLTAEGTPPDVARELAMSELFPAVEEE